MNKMTVNELREKLNLLAEVYGDFDVILYQNQGPNIILGKPDTVFLGKTTNFHTALEEISPNDTHKANAVVIAAT